MPNTVNNKKIAKNTLMLYFRMLLSMIVSLYTSRVVLNVLGIEDFGIYNVVGGVIIMLGFLNNAMAASTQRFLTFEIGRNDFERLKNVFNMSLTIHFFIALSVFIVAETFGVWFLNSQLNIPSERIYAANWVYQFSILSFIITVISVPYNAAIIANEKMKIFAIIGILEVILKLIIVFLLLLFSLDKLILYSFLLFVVSIIIRVFYMVYCKKQFKETKNYTFQWNNNLFKEMGSFASWNLLGVFAGIGYNQGVNILLNIFFGPVINAARGIAFQVNSAVNSFVVNFQIAVNPSVTKFHAIGDNKSSFNLVFSASKFSFYLLFLLSLPLLIETELILKWWLKIVPPFAAIFTRLILIDVIIGTLSGSLQILAQATGNIKKYQIIVSGILLLNLPTSYLFLKFGYSPEFTLIISIFYSCLALLMRLIVLKNIVEFPIMDFFTKVILKVILVSSVAIIFPLFAERFLTDSIYKFFIVLVISTSSIILTVILLGLNHTERLLAQGYYFKIRKKLNL